MDKNINSLYQALVVLTDWFHQLGGAAQYSSYQGTDIPIYVGCRLIRHLDLLSDPDETLHEFNNERFTKAAETSLFEANRYIDEISQMDRVEAIKFVREFVEYINIKLPKISQKNALAWKKFCQMVDELDV